MFCPPRPATATSLPLPEMIRDMYYVDAASSASAYRSPLWLRNYSSYIVHLAPLLPKRPAVVGMETAPLFQKPNLPIHVFSPSSARHTNNTKKSSKALRSTKKSRLFRHMCERPRPRFTIKPSTNTPSSFFFVHHFPSLSPKSRRWSPMETAAPSQKMHQLIYMCSVFPSPPLLSKHKTARDA